MVTERKTQYYQDNNSSQTDEVPIKTPASYFGDIEKLLLKFV